jgi:hypothetical protein
MALIAVRDPVPPDPAALRAAAGALPPGAPVVVMLHGYRYSPARPGGDPHRHILSLAPDRSAWGAVSWPRRLGLAGGGGLALAWGWEAGGSLWGAHRRARRVGARVAALAGMLRAAAPGRPVHLFAHSLGARVALAALSKVEPGAIARAILIAPAASRAEARAAADSPGGRAAEVVAVSGRENLPFDGLMRLALPWEGRRLGPGDVTAPGWLDLPLDRPEALAGLARLGWRVPPARAAVCHWSGYLRPGIWALYRDLLHRPEATPLPVLRAATAREAERAPLPTGAVRAI